MNDKSKLVFRISVACLLCVLFVGSCIYTLAVYFSIGIERVEPEFHFEEICRPYLNISQVGTNESKAVEDYFRNFQEVMMFPRCIDVLLPVICQHPIIPRDLNVSGGGIDDMNAALLEECDLPTEFLFLANLPTVYYENITCADGFYRLNYTCRARCSLYEQINHTTASFKIGFFYFATIFNILFTAIFIAVALFKRKTMFKFPSIVFVYIVIIQAIWPTCILINLLSGRTLLCSDDDLLMSVRKPSPYCAISGVLNASCIILTWLWFLVLATVMFWKLLFTTHAHRYRNYEKWINIFPFIIGGIFLIPYIVTTTADRDFYYIQSEFPTFFCQSRNSDFGLLYILFPAVFLSSLGILLLLIVLLYIQMKFGCFIWRGDDVMNTAEKKILFLLFFVGLVTVIGGIYFVLFISNTQRLGAALIRNFLCELPGYMDNENDPTTCSKDDLEMYSYTGLSIAFVFFSYALLPLVFLVTVIEWRSFLQKIEILFGLKSESALNLSKGMSRNDRTANGNMTRLQSFADEKKTKI